MTKRIPIVGLPVGLFFGGSRFIQHSIQLPLCPVVLKQLQMLTAK